MATETKNKAKTAKAAEKIQETVTAVAEENEQARPIKPKEIDQSQLITVLNGRHGRLIYRSPRTREKFVWPEFGSEQEMELRELRNVKNTAKKFFMDNWFMFDDEFKWVIDYLGVRQFYKNALPLDSFDDLFKKSAADITKIIGGLSDGQKKSVGYRARQLVAEGEIDSRKAIDALETALGIELIER